MHNDVRTKNQNYGIRTGVSDNGIRTKVNNDHGVRTAKLKDSVSWYTYA